MNEIQKMIFVVILVVITFVELIALAAILEALSVVEFVDYARRDMAGMVDNHRDPDPNRMGDAVAETPQPRQADEDPGEPLLPLGEDRMETGA